MKKIIISMLTMAAMVACSSESDLIDGINPQNGKVEIKGTAGLNQIDTKSSGPIASGSNNLPTNEVTDVHFFRVDGTSPDWATSTPTNFSGTIGTDGAINWGTQYYPSDNKSVNILGIHTGNSTAPSVTTGTVAITIDGTNDILYATPKSGSKDVGAKLSFQFDHKLTQLKFTFQKDASLSESVTISSVKIIKLGGNELNSTFKLALSNGELSDWGTAISSGVELSNVISTALETTASSTSTGVMLEPNKTSVTVQVEANIFPSGGVQATIDAGSLTQFSAGKSYTIGLTLKQKTIQTENTTITGWDDITGPSGDII